MTWEWLGQEAALDVANTVTIENGIERDLWAMPGGYDRWARAEAVAADGGVGDLKFLIDAKPEIVAIRGPVRDVVAAASGREPAPIGAVGRLNAASREAPEWLEVDPASNRLATRAVGPPKVQLAARYARSALRIVAAAADGSLDLRRCPAPSCGMFFEPARSDQTWCSRPCGTRARVARHLLRTRPA